MIATALSTVTLRTDTDSSIMRRYDLQLIRSQTRATYLAAASSKLLAAFGMDFINQFLPRIPTIPKFTPGLSTVFSEFEILPDLSFRYLDGTWSGTGGVAQGPRLGEYLGKPLGDKPASGSESIYSDLSMAVFENYAYVFWSTILSDLGVSSKPNILTNVDLFRQTIHSNLSPPRGISVTWINGTAVDYILSDTTSFHLPFNDVRPTLFNARYICRKVAWKEPGSLVGDVLVATISFFMAFWSGLHITLRYFAVGSSAHSTLFVFVYFEVQAAHESTEGNYCTCPTCEGQAEDKASDMISLNELNFPDAESHYEPLVQHT
ncbi:hypothetical protein FRC12_000563 [Ceratobasidium sp. 428]|nr:hypothetical protein FRC12_000563 [Ceratobasidium sp. 428]